MAEVLADEPPSPSRQRSLVHEVPLVLPAACLVLGVVLDRHAWSGETGVWMTLVIAACALMFVRRMRGVSIALACVAAGGMWHQIKYWDEGKGEFGHPDRWPAWVRGTIVEDAVFRPGGEWPGHPGFTRTVLEVSARRLNDGWRPSRGRLLLSIPSDRSDLNVGDPVEATGMLSEIEPPLNPGEADLRDFWRMQGVWSRLQVDLPEGVRPCLDGSVPPRIWLQWLGRTRRWSRERLTGALDPTVAPIALALLLGRRDAIDPDLNDAFARTGTTHLLAISGLHLQALAILLHLCFRAMGLPRRRALFLVGLASVGYGALVGFAPSVVRSLVMTVVACLSGLRNRKIARTPVFAAAVIFTVMFNPSNVFDIGCQLSFLAVGAILWAVPPVIDFLRQQLQRNERSEQMLHAYESDLVALVRRFRWGLFEGLVISVVVWAMAWPLVAWKFHVSSPLGVLLNILLIPITTFALFASGITLMLSGVWLPLTIPSAFVTALLLGWTSSMVRWGAVQRWGMFFVAGPSLWWMLGFYALLGLIWWLAQDRRRRSRDWACAILGVWLVIGPLTDAPSRATSIRFLAVGHGLAVVVQSEGHAVLYDGGRMGDSSVGRRVIAPALWASGIRSLDAVFLSHSDSDHFSGIPDVIERIPTAVLHVPTRFDDARDKAAAEMLQAVKDRGVPIRPFDEGQTLTLSPTTRLTALHPPPDWTEGSKDNERSLVLDVEIDGHHTLLTGDLEGAGLQRLLGQEPPAVPFEVTLSPHHGSKAANPAALFAWAQSSIVIASQKPPIGLPPNFDRHRAVESDVDINDSLSDAIGAEATLVRTWRRGATTIEWLNGQRVVSFFAKPDSPPPPSPKGLHPLNVYALASLLFAWKPWLITIAGLAAGLGLAFVIFVVEWGASALVNPRRKLTLPLPTDDEGANVSTAIVANDGSRLVGTWYPATPTTTRTVVLLHGLAEDRSNLRARASSLHALGWNVAILDGRGFGESGGEAVAFGGYEADDLTNWLDHLIAQFGTDSRLAVWGRSMGAAIALRSSCSDARIGALILEAPYADLHQTLATVLRRYRLPAVAFLSRLILGKAKRLARTSLHLPRPIDLAAQVKVPTLILRGSEDTLVSAEEVNRLAASFAVQLEVIEIPGAGHANITDIGGNELFARLAAFLDQAMQSQMTAAGTERTGSA